jgi:hypothetical protein
MMRKEELNDALVHAPSKAKESSGRFMAGERSNEGTADEETVEEKRLDDGESRWQSEVKIRVEMNENSLGHRGR